MTSGGRLLLLDERRGKQTKSNWQGKQTKSSSSISRLTPVRLEIQVQSFDKVLSFHFGFRVRDESRKPCWSDLQLQQEQNGDELLV